MANNKDFITKNPIEVGGSTKTTIGTISSDAIQSSFDLANASYDGVVLNNGSITQARNVTFKPDGTRMYVCQNNDRVYQFDLSTAWNISTASLNGNYDPAQDSDPKDVIFNSNGTKMYIAGDQNDRTYQYSLSTAWDVSSASYDSVSHNATGQTAGIFGINFNDDGTSFYVIGTPDVIYQYSLSSAYDLSTASYASKSFSVTDDDDSAGGFTFNNDGTKLFYVGYENDLVHQYSLSTAWDISTATADGVTFSVTTQNTVPVDVTFSGDGTKMYITGFSGGDIYQYSTGILAEELDLSTGNYFSYTPSGNTTYGFANASEAQSFQLEVTGGSVGYGLADIVYDGVSFSVASQEGNVRSLVFSVDGTKMYIIGQANDRIYQYSLSTAWDLSTASYDSKLLNVSSQEGTPQGIFFKSDGTKVYVVGTTNDTVYQYSLSTAWDVSTGSYDSVSFSVATQETAPQALFFKSDGTKMYITGQNGDAVVEYSLSTAWNVSTASLTSSFSILSESSASTGLHFKNDGTGFFIVDVVYDTVYQYSLSAPWNVSTASYDNISFDASVNVSAIHSLFFKSDGTKMYILANGNDTVLQYTTVSDATITWPTSVQWSGGATPAATGSGEKDVYTFTTDDGGTTYHGYRTADNLS